MTIPSADNAKSDRFALVTGASMGLGQIYARRLAARGLNLIVTARSEEQLQKLASELRQDHGIQVHVFPADLSHDGAAVRIAEYVKARNLNITWLINNAGFGDAGAFETLSHEKVRAICMVNIVALSHLTALILPHMLNGTGDRRIMNIASVAGFQPVPYFGVYSASKAYVISFSEALYEELKPKGIKVLCVCPGYTETNFARNNGINKRYFKGAQSADEVVEQSLKASDAGKAILITRNRAQVFAARFAPRVAVRKFAAAIAKTYTRN